MGSARMTMAAFPPRLGWPSGATGWLVSKPPLDRLQPHQAERGILPPASKSLTGFLGRFSCRFAASPTGGQRHPCLLAEGGFNAN